MIFVVFSLTYSIADQIYKNNGLTVQEITYEVDDKEVSSAAVPLNKVFKIKFKEVKGFNVITVNQQQVVFPKVSIEVFSSKKERVLYEENALKDFAKTGIPSFFLSTLTATISTGHPFNSGDVYQVSILISDMRGKGTIEYQTELKIEEESVRMSVEGSMEFKGLTAEKTGMVKDDQLVPYNTFLVGDEFKMVILNVKGFSQDAEGKSFVQMSFKIMNMQKEVLFSNDRLLEDKKSLILANGSLKMPYVTIKTKDLLPGSYIVEVGIYDQLNENHLIAKKPFVLLDRKTTE